jgi:GWxTD domain-containing protein
MACRVACPLLVLLAAGAPAGGGAQQRDSSGARDRFAAATEARLDSLYGPLLYVMQADERGIYPALSVGRKRDYLRRFWGRRDPTPGTPKNELEDEFYARTAEANRRFREGGAAPIPGWRTARGRIFIKYGPPGDVLSRPGPSSTLPYEVWKYARQPAEGTGERKYCFVDVTRFGNYALVWTTDPNERSEPNWQQLLGREAYEDVMRF